MSFAINTDLNIDDMRAISELLDKSFRRGDWTTEEVKDILFLKDKVDNLVNQFVEAQTQEN
jgi:hypothetical protein